MDETETTGKNSTERATNTKLGASQDLTWVTYHEHTRNISLL